MTDQTSKSGNTREDDIRRYLQYLDDPTSLVDTALVEVLRARLDTETDPIARLKIHAGIEAAMHVDRGVLEAAFCSVAAEWAREYHVGTGAFRSMGVPDAVLREAGILETPRARNVRRGRGASGVRVDRASVAAVALSLADPFTLRQLGSASGASVGTVRAVVDDLVASGALVDAGADPEHAGRGRAPVRYARA